jgi:hypothetical protein
MEFKRIGWIEQLHTDDLEYGVRVDWFDRFSCHWQGRAEDGYRMRRGPACVELDDMLTWCERHCQQAFADVFGSRWSIGSGAESEHYPPLSEVLGRIVEESVSWSEASGKQQWPIDVSMHLGPLDYDDAAAVFERSLRALATVEACSTEVRLRTFSARLIVSAPDFALAQQLARDVMGQAASDLPNGLRDENGDGFGANVVHPGARLVDPVRRNPPGAGLRIIGINVSRNE